MLQILHIEMNGGWEYLDTNKAAMDFPGGIEMVEYILSLHGGTDHPKMEGSSYVWFR